MTGVSWPFPGRCLCAALLLLMGTACTPLNETSSRSSDVASCLTALPAPRLVNGLFVEPDDGLDPLVDELAAAACTIDVSVYILSDDIIIATLIAAEARGVSVRVMLEEFPFGGGGGQIDVKHQLEEAGVEVRWSASDIRFSHAKYLVVDRQVALIMNQNLTTSAFTTNREFGVTTTHPASVVQAQEIFDRDWRHDPLDDPEGPLVVSPTDSRQQLLGLIEGAGRTIDFYAEVIRDDEIVDALRAAEARGVEVRLVVDESLDEDTGTIVDELRDAGVEIRLSGHLYIHAKLMVIDRDQAIVGSQNFTATSLDDNREIAIVVTDALILERCETIYERDWQRARPNTLSPGLDMHAMYVYSVRTVPRGWEGGFPTRPGTRRDELRGSDRHWRRHEVEHGMARVAGRRTRKRSTGIEATAGQSGLSHAIHVK